MSDKFEQILDICSKEFLIPFESYAAKLPNGDCAAYPDPASPLARAIRAKQPTEGLSGDPWTIGYGSTYDENGNRVKEGDIWSHEKAVMVKRIVIIRYLTMLLRESPNLISEPPRRIAAVLSWVYNLGIGNYRISTFKRKINEKNWSEAYEQCLRWDKAQGRTLRGLTLRRTAEGNAIVNP